MRTCFPKGIEDLPWMLAREVLEAEYTGTALYDVSGDSRVTCFSFTSMAISSWKESFRGGRSTSTRIRMCGVAIVSLWMKVATLTINLHVDRPLGAILFTSIPATV